MATLKISNLSVGDWVEYEGLHYPITFVGYKEGGDGSLVNLIRPDLSCFTCKISDIHPTPITAETLEKNGFIRRSDEFVIYEYTTLLGKMLRTTQVFLTTPQSINIFLHDTTIERGLYHREKTSVSIFRDEVYVHDLQHAIRLAGLDKEIKL